MDLERAASVPLQRNSMELPTTLELSNFSRLLGRVCGVSSL